jgi:tetratricopeptide (TPR) repeat protein
VAWLWFLGAMVPVIGLVQVGSQGMADRYTYLPMLGLVLALVLLGEEAARRLRRPASLAAPVALAILAALSWLTWRQQAVWADTVTLWQYTLDHEPKSDVVRAHLWNVEARRLADRRDLNGAIARYRDVLKLDPGNQEALSNLGICLGMAGRHHEALEPLGKVLAANPNDADARCNLGTSLLQEPGRVDEAVAHFRRALELEPDKVEAYVGLARAETARGRHADAADHWRQVLRFNPSAEVRLFLAKALHKAGRLDEAADQLRRALDDEPDLAGARAELDQVLKEPVQQVSPSP